MDFKPLQDWWWLILAVIAAIAAFVKYTIKIHEAVEGLKRVAEHDKRLAIIGEQYTNIKADTEGLSKSVDELAESLKAHCAEQKDDFKSINIAVYAILDILRKGGDSSAAEIAHQELRKHTLGKG